MTQIKKQVPKKTATIEVAISSKTIATTIAPTKVDTTLFNGRKVQKSDLVMNEAGDIFASSYYVDSSGDLIKKANINGCSCVITEFCDISLARMAENAMYIASDDNKPTSVSRAPRVKVNDDMIEICEISLGHWRNTISKVADIEKYVIGKRVYYDKSTGQRKDKDNGNTDFRTIIMCDNSNIEVAKNMLKNIFKVNSKIAVEWL